MFGEVVESGPGVGEVGVAARLLGRDLDGAEEGEGRPARVEGRVDVEERVAAVRVCAGRFRIDDVIVPVQVAGVEELDVLVPHLPPRAEVPADVIQVAQLIREGDVAVVVQARLAEDTHPVLFCASSGQAAAKGESLAGHRLLPHLRRGGNDLSLSLVRQGGAVDALYLGTKRRVQLANRKGFERRLLNKSRHLASGAERLFAYDRPRLL